MLPPPFLNGDPDTNTLPFAKVTAFTHPTVCMGEQYWEQITNRMGFLIFDYKKV